jgi:LysR family transcriptional regulator, regulator for bpeEF and oprC
MDRLQHLEVFVRVAETGSFTRAAGDLNLPRSTVSMHIQTLEARIGARLLHRTTRRVNLTPDGEAYYERALRLLADFEEAEGLFRAADAPPRGRLRVDVPARIGRLVVAPALPDFFARHPEIELELGSTDRAIDLIQEGVDCVVRVGGLSDSRLVARPLGALVQINVASPTYLARHGTPLTLEDLTHHRAVHYASPSTGRLDEWEVAESGERSRRIPMPGSVTVNNAETYIACCLAGLGLIQIPAYDVQDELRAGQLVEVLPQWRAAPMPMHAVYPHRRHLSRRVQAFVEWIGSLFAERLRQVAGG